MGYSFNCEDVLKMIESHNTQLSAKIERVARRAPQLPTLYRIKRILKKIDFKSYDLKDWK